MKKIINGTLYDTKTAKQLEVFCNELKSSDPNYCEEILYKTQAGEYFLYGEHGPKFDFMSNSKWAKTKRKDIIACSLKELDEWYDMILEKIREIIAELQSGLSGQKTMDMK